MVVADDVADDVVTDDIDNDESDVIRLLTLFTVGELFPGKQTKRVTRLHSFPTHTKTTERYEKDRIGLDRIENNHL